MSHTRRHYDRPANRCELLIGRTLAMCLHPVAAWRCGSLRAKVAVVAGYFVAAYTITLSALAVFGPPYGS